MSYQEIYEEIRREALRGTRRERIREALRGTRRERIRDVGRLTDARSDLAIAILRGNMITRQMLRDAEITLEEDA